MSSDSSYARKFFEHRQRALAAAFACAPNDIELEFDRAIVRVIRECMPWYDFSQSGLREVATCFRQYVLEDPAFPLSFYPRMASPLQNGDPFDAKAFVASESSDLGFTTYGENPSGGLDEWRALLASSWCYYRHCDDEGSLFPASKIAGAVDASRSLGISGISPETIVRAFASLDNPPWSGS